MLNDGLVFLIWKDIFPSLAARWVLNSDQIKCQFPFSGFNGKLRKSLSNKGKLDREISGPKDRTPCTHGSDKDIFTLVSVDFVNQHYNQVAIVGNRHCFGTQTV